VAAAAAAAVAQAAEECAAMNHARQRSSSAATQHACNQVQVQVQVQAGGRASPSGRRAKPQAHALLCVRPLVSAQPFAERCPPAAPQAAPRGRRALPQHSQAYFGDGRQELLRVRASPVQQAGCGPSAPQLVRGGCGCGGQARYGCGKRAVGSGSKTAACGCTAVASAGTIVTPDLVCAASAGAAQALAAGRPQREAWLRSARAPSLRVQVVQYSAA
jgi:hypothetical protein